MDAVEFIKERNRMCNNYACCTDCPLGGKEHCNSILNVDAQKIVPIVEQWTKEHPVKTRQSEFLKMFPDARIGQDGVLNICPSDMLGKCPNVLGEVCHYDNCRREFWGQEVE